MSDMAPQGGRDQLASDRPRRRRRAFQPEAEVRDHAGSPETVRVNSVPLPPLSFGTARRPLGFEQAWERRKGQGPGGHGPPTHATIWQVPAGSWQVRSTK